MSDQKRVTFDVVAADSAAEIFLIDGDFRLVKKGIGHETFAVPPGIYKLKNRSGRTTTEELIVVREGMSTVRLDPVCVSSAMPLLDSARTHEYHMSAASGAAAAPNLSRGTGSNIVLVARQWTGQTPRESSIAPPNPARGLRLLDRAGTVIADVAALTQVHGTLDPIVTLNVELTPGSYCLSLAYADGRRVSQTVIASPGWQTHVYLLIDGTVEDDAARVDLVNGAITLRKPGQPFRADDPHLRAEEIARGALRDSHDILSEAVRAQFISPAAPPMLALIGAHLLIRQANDERERLATEPIGTSAAVSGNREELRRIVENLRAALGKHLDVEAVASVAGNPDPTFVFDTPPMLRASWPLLLDVSVRRPAAIPADSVTAHAAERIWGEGPWLQWLEADPRGKADRTALWQAKARELIASMDASSARSPQAFLQHAPAALPMAASTWRSDWSNEGSSLVATPVSASSSVIAIAAGILARTAQRLLTTRARTPFPTLIESPQRAAQPAVMDLHKVSTLLTDEHRAQLVRQLGVPLSRINSWLEDDARATSLNSESSSAPRSHPSHSSARLPRMGRNIVICCDGTNNQFGICNTDVVRIVQICKQEPDVQLTYYDPGVGTIPEQGFVTRVGKWFSEARALAFGTDIEGKVSTAYAHLMEVWQPGDEVYVLGFSRGAYTARMLAGLLHALGLLPPGNAHLLPYVMRLYSSMRNNTGESFHALCDSFRWSFARPCGQGDDRRFPVHFLGLWDTVSSVGWIWNPATYPYTAHNPSVKVVRHAVALDERRCFFRQNLFSPGAGQDVKERWFAGVHSDVGGGYPERDGGLWRESFEWMLAEARAAGLEVDEARLEAVTTSSPVPTKPWAEQQHESLKGVWWLAEIFPKLVYDFARQRKRPQLGLGRSRMVTPGAVISESAMKRMRDTDYAPRNLKTEFIMLAKANRGLVADTTYDA